MALLAIRDLGLTIGRQPILKDVSLAIEPGEVLGLVGESGSGKSLTALSVMRLLPHGSVTSGSIDFAGTEILAASEARMCALRGDDIGMVFQEPMTALNPVKTIGEQIAEGIRLHTGASRAEAAARAAQMMERVGLPVADFPLSRFPHQLSGGQRQRVVIAIACALNPRLLIADEPTTALDVTIQAQILDLLRDLVRERSMALLLITHDLGVVAGMADRIAVMRSGEILDHGPAVPLLRQRRHPYTRRLAEASAHVPTRRGAPILDRAARAEARRPLLEVRELVVQYPAARRGLFRRPPPFRAVRGVSFDIYSGQTMALVGESGCGKSTLARTILGLQRPASGTLVFDGLDIASGDGQAIAAARRELQIVFQDPYGSFNPRHRVERLVAEPLFLRPELGRAEKQERVARALEAVGLSAGDAAKYPHEFSGGQRQRLAIARALVNRPKLIIADEPVSALDVSIRAQILDLLSDLRDRFGIAYLFISHDLSVVRALCDEVLVMRQGEFVERGPVDEVFDRPSHPYTRELTAAAPDLERALAQA
ncbi:MAG: ABC transporter ATP-binding protein [Alphaproteobacteria bacterium]|nr:MAG: ABC transporter ATP-binding protein [Alphaproteobacteria bacterium]